MELGVAGSGSGVPKVLFGLEIVVRVLTQPVVVAQLPAAVTPVLDTKTAMLGVVVVPAGATTTSTAPVA